MTKQGHPTVVLVHEVFERAALSQARELHMPDLRICVFPQSASIDPEEREREKAVRVVEQIQELLR
ncbi:MAG: hypothetical protein HY681_07645 [Chloroflexi bacterium]|nr:hypothetical protein [Chloroflexota bacterium]